jgi:hypothetical protein
MGKVYQHIGEYLPATIHGMFVEIGSDRGEGSTQHLDRLAAQRGTKLITVDMLSKAKSWLETTCTSTEFVVSDGATWAQEFAENWTDVAVLYLDNFDYIWDINNVSPAIEVQMRQYASGGTPMTNQACQIEHLKQLMLLYPCLAPNAVVAFDDTYCYNDCWIGKCGPAVVYLLACGWEVVHQTIDCGVILTRKKK